MMALSTSKVDTAYIAGMMKEAMVKPPKPSARAGRYHHGNLRRSLLDAALALVEESGPGALSLREIARRAGVSHAAPYRHFKSRESLIVALAEEGFRGLGEEMLALTAGEAEPLRRFRALGLAYVRYAVAHPGHFKVMFSSVLHEGADTPELADAGAPTLQALIDTVAAGQAVGLVRAGDAQRLALPAWSMVHGLSMLLVDRQLAALGADGVEVDRLAEGVIEVTMRGLAPDAPVVGRPLRRRRPT
jgi:AcrR family transcriptional regulator